MGIICIQILSFSILLVIILHFIKIKLGNDDFSAFNFFHASDFKMRKICSTDLDLQSPYLP